MMRFKNMAFCLLLAAGALTSCIKDDRSNCYRDNLLMLSYKGDGTTEIFGDKICRVDMYIFDSQNQCVSGKIELTEDEVKNRTVLLPRLQPGDYRIVCLGNTHHTGVSNLGATDFSKIYFSDNGVLTRSEFATGNDSLYYACDEYTVTREEQSKVIEFASSHYDVLVEVASIPDPTPEGGQFPVLRLEGVMPHTDFNNRAFGETVTYQPETTHDAATMQMTARFNIMRHGGKDGDLHHENVNLRLLASNGEELARVNLGEFLAANSQFIDCSKHEVLIPIRIEFLSGNVSVSVPDWYIEEVYPGYQK